MVVKPIQNKDTYWFLLNVHYAKRIPSISYSFGLFEHDKLIGVCTYGTPPSATLRTGIIRNFDGEYKVLELNRLCLIKNEKNYASFLVGNSLKLLPPKTVVVSYADTSQGHIGYVYQATNFIYTGLSAKRTDWKIKGMEHLHGQTIADIGRGKKNRAAYLREKFGDRFYLKERPRKHRYVYFVGDRRWKRVIKKHLAYPILPYPKNKKEKHEV